MSEVLPGHDQGLPTPESDARPSVSPRVQGIAPAWEPAEPISQSEPLDPHVVEAARGLFLEPGRSGMAGTAELIGSAVGSAQRQVRRGLELVRNLPSSGASHASQVEHEILNHAASTLHELAEDVADIRHEAARRLDEWSEEIEERFQQLRREVSSALPRLRTGAQQFASRYPLQTIAAIAGVGFAFGMALRLNRRSHRG